MHRARQAMIALLGLAALGMSCTAPDAWSAGIDCAGHWLSRTELAICDDPRLLRMEEQMRRRISGYAQRLTFGQYLGLRHWHATRAEARKSCGIDRNCIVASFRAQSRFLDRLQRCVATSLVRRACLHNLLTEDGRNARH